MEHWRVAELGAVSTGQHSIRKLRLVHHGSYQVFGSSNFIVKGVRIIYAPIIIYILGLLLNCVRLVINSS